jgi:protein SCO1/2
MQTRRKLNRYFYGLVLLLASCQAADKKTFVSELPYYNTPDFMPHWISSDSLKGYHQVPSFSLVNQSGDTISNSSLAGKIYVANFFFTTCGSICPRMTANLQQVSHAFAGENSVFLLSHTVTPEIDSVPRLRAYMEHMKIDGTRWWLLTGNKDSIYRLARQGYFADEVTGYNKDSREFLHTENCVLVDVNGHIRGVYNATLELEMEKLIRHIRILKKEMPGNK